MLDADKQDHEFADILYQQWSQTTGAETSYWMPVHKVDELGQHDSFGIQERWDIFAVDQKTDESKWVGSVLSEEDADFIAGLHGAVPDLIRRLHDAIDEATRKDEANDLAQNQLAEALLEIEKLKGRIFDLEDELAYWMNS